MPESPLQSPARAEIESLVAGWRKTDEWIENAARLTGERDPDAEFELFKAGEAVVFSLERTEGPPDFSTAMAHILKSQQYAVEAIVSRIGDELQDLRNKVGEQLLQERFPENKYGHFLRQLARAAEMSKAAKDSDEARKELLTWAENELPALRELREDLRAAEPAILDEKNTRVLKRRRELGLILAGIFIGLAGIFVGWLF